ncbi:MAG: 50S ribosomal protein L17 [Dehalococcoidia bacterium]|nr:50S ribosomal protein L17 [Dehalococcoidia bacterium]
MRHRVDGRKLGRSTEHRLALYRNLVTSFLNYEKIVTTEAKAKEMRGMAEKIITLGKEGSLASRRRVAAFVTDKKVISKVFDELATTYANRSGGYTRLVKLGPRQGDNAPMIQVELVK